MHQAQAELAQAARVSSLAELATGIAHEVNQPLSAIDHQRAGRAAAARRTSGRRGHARCVLQDIVGDGKRASGVITRIRGLVKHSPLRPGRLDMNEVINEWSR